MPEQNLRLRRKKIVLTGGHAATTAVAVVEALKKDPKINWQIYWIGAASAMEARKVPTLGMKILPKLGVGVYTIKTGRLQKKFSRQTIPALAKVPLGFVSALYLLLKLKPNVTFSFGGFAAFPVVLGSWLLRIPVLIHEQTVATGLANKISAPFAKQIAIARKESSQFFPKEKTHLVGNPIAFSILAMKPKDKISDKPTLLITGGSTGAQRINHAVDAILEKLLRVYEIIHQTGELDFAHFQKRKNNLPTDLSEKYEVHDFIENIVSAYEKADIVVGRAGANTVAEIMAARRPAILIPIPWTRYNEQVKNAQLAQASGIAEIIDQEALTGDLLLREIAKVKSNWPKMVRNMNQELTKLDAQAAQKLVELAGGLAR